MGPQVHEDPRLALPEVLAERGRGHARALREALERIEQDARDFYDYYVRTIIGGSLQTWNTNITMRRIWMEDVEGANISMNHATSSDPGDFKTVSITESLFIGVAGELDGGGDAVTIASNTFYRCSFNEGHTGPITVGGTETYTNDAITLSYNLMVGCGDHRAHTNEGYPTITATTTKICSSTRLRPVVR